MLGSLDWTDRFGGSSLTPSVGYLYLYVFVSHPFIHSSTVPLSLSWNPL